MSFDSRHAVERNRYWSGQLGWMRDYERISREILGITDHSPSWEQFSEAVYHWQQGESRLGADGIIGPNSWRRMQETFAARANPGRAAARSWEGRKGVILAPAHNSPGRSDATGAFHIGARQFASIHHLPEPVLFNNRAEERVRRAEVLDAIRGAAGPLEVVAYFGHGVTDWLPSAGVRPRHTGDFAEAIRGNSAAQCAVVLYACSAGAFGGFASNLAGRLNGQESSSSNRRVVYGHTTSGHTFWNARVTVFPAAEYLIAPGSTHWAAWSTALRSTDLWARFPFMSMAEIEQELRGGR